MPLTDSTSGGGSGFDEWLQSLMANFGLGQAPQPATRSPHGPYGPSVDTPNLVPRPQPAAPPPPAGASWPPSPVNSAWLGDNGGYMPSMPSLPSLPPAASAPQPFVQPQHPSTMRYSSWPTPLPGAAPAASPATPTTAAPSRPVTPTPATAYPSGPAKPAPNLGYGFTPIDRPNMPANAGPIGPGGPRQMSALDLSQLFKRRAAS